MTDTHASGPAPASEASAFLDVFAFRDEVARLRAILTADQRAQFVRYGLDQQPCPCPVEPDAARIIDVLREAGWRLRAITIELDWPGFYVGIRRAWEMDHWTNKRNGWRYVSKDDPSAPAQVVARYTNPTRAPGAEWE